MSQTDLSVQLDTQVERLLDRSDKDGVSLALVIQQSGNVIVERYGTQPENVFQPEIEITADSTLTSWSMAKSITHGALGALIYVQQHVLSGELPPETSWGSVGNPRNVAIGKPEFSGMVSK